MRIGGAVVPGSIHHTADGADFELTEGGETVLVDHHGTEPTLFKNCAPVVADGHWSGTHVRVRADPDQARLDLRAAERTSRRTCPPDPFGRS